MKILIIPGNVQNAKSYPHWDGFKALAKAHDIKTMEGILKEEEIVNLINWCDTWISIDSFVQHLVTYHRLKPGIVLWGKSNPDLFGYKTNVNLLKGRKYLRDQQFKWWRDESPNPDAFVSPEIVLWEAENLYKNKIDIPPQTLYD
jgi:hypothetical protein